ncbi:MAG: chorismate mutase [Clostridia bacterium]|nr:chorismate mutase [Clostridia bacterium]
MADIENARKEINRIDREMSKLFEMRMHAAQEVAEYKRERGLQIEDKSREAEVIARNSEYVENEQIRSHYVNFLQHLMDLSKSYQHTLISGHRVAYSGVPGAFANIAAKKLFPDCEAVPYPDFKAAYEACESGECDIALLPVENSFNGDVGQVMDLAFFGSLYINDVYEAEVVQNLLANEDATLDSIKTVISHPQALGQCAKYIRSHGYETQEAVNTAVAAKLVAQSGKTDIAAIGSEEAAEQYGLKKLAVHINESGTNATRFAVFSRVMKNDTRDDDRFIMMFTVKNQPGSLGKAVSAIGENGFNLRALKSRPTKDSSWCYYFYVEGEGRIDSFDGRRMLSQLEPNCLSVKIIGSYKE